MRSGKRFEIDRWRDELEALTFRCMAGACRNGWRLE
jgi:hypothetical protein